MLQVIVVFYVPGLAFGMPVENRVAAVLVASISTMRLKPKQILAQME